MCLQKLERSGDLADKTPEVFLLSARSLVEDVAGVGTCDLHILKDKTFVYSLFVDVKQAQQLWSVDCLIGLSDLPPVLRTQFFFVQFFQR